MVIRYESININQISGASTYDGIIGGYDSVNQYDAMGGTGCQGCGTNSQGFGGNGGNLDNFILGDCGNGI